MQQSSNKAELWGFDFVEEFDGLEDWDQSECIWYHNQCGNRYDDRFPELMPQLADGGKGPWGYFSVWNTNASAEPWIGPASGDRQVWRGTKSATIDIGKSNRGPSRLGLYFANGGYRDFRVFYMVWIPANMYPTSCEGTEGRCSGGGPIGTYTEGEPYQYFASWKFNTFNMQCETVNCSLVNDTYGLHHTVPQIKQYNYTPNGLIIVNANRGGPAPGFNGRAIDDGHTTLNSSMGQWWGVEFHIRNISNDTEYMMDIWVYDKEGYASHVMFEQVFPINEDAQGGVWDQFFFGGNNANSWNWGPTMQSHYYIDDFIVDGGEKGQIGPRYFEAIR
ncbi:hypothetical protein [Halopseudomonas salegens]|uniref:hypothetical protein n=1 Tax=Halopseudomonas salegens TaxID=1434072 RepID=UPI000B843310|nr:hypothetical protein [Halopseudomonas salegens]